MNPEVVVTANRVLTPAQQVGSAITVVTEEQLEERQQQTVADALRDVPGVSVTRGGGLGSVTEVRLRGAETDHTLVLIDGIRANDPAFASVFDFGHLLTGDVERIEILRGPQSALWGSDAIGGVVNIITKRGRGPLTADARVEVGRYDTRQLVANVSGGGDNYDFAFSGTRLETDGFSTAPGGDENDGYDNTTASFTGGLKPTRDLRFDLVLRNTSTSKDTDRQVFDFPPEPDFGKLVDADLVSETDQSFGRLQGKLTTLEGLWDHTAGIMLTDTDNKNKEDGKRTSKNSGKLRKVFYQSDLFFDTPEFGAGEHTFTFALEHVHEEFKQRGATPEAPRNQNQHMTNKSAIAELKSGFLGSLFLTAALRYDNNELFKNSTTYRLTGSYLFERSGSRLHASYGEGVKNPSFLQLFGFFPDSFQGNPDLKPEEAKGWDAGFEQTFLDGGAVFDLTYFDVDLTDEIVDVFSVFPFTVENADGKSSRRGVELTLSAGITDALRLAASYTYTDAKDANGDRELRRPKNTGSVNLNYRFAEDRGNVNLGASYVGKRRDNDFADYDPVTLAPTVIELDSYTLVNIAASYQFNPHLRVFGRIENLLDENYEEVVGFATPGRAAYVGLRLGL
jgi:vitamin B12 transporter